MVEVPSAPPFRFVRTMPLRPGRFIVNNPASKTPDWSIPRGFVSPEPDVVGPLQTAMYVGRVEDVQEDGSYSVRVWEVPNGRVGMINLTRAQLGDVEVEAGDTLRVYAWLEISLSADGSTRENAMVRAIRTPRKTLSSEERERLRRLLQSLEGEP
jgi:hypothetical protein